MQKWCVHKGPYGHQKDTHTKNANSLTCNIAKVVPYCIIESGLSHCTPRSLISVTEPHFFSILCSGSISIRLYPAPQCVLMKAIHKS